MRFYDTKAQIVGVGYILALNLVLHFGDLLPNHAPIGPLFFAVVWLIVIMPIVQFGQVLYPSRTRADRELVAKRPAVPVTRTSITSIPTGSPMSANSSSKPSSPTGPRSSLPSFSRPLASGSSSRRASVAA